MSSLSTFECFGLVLHGYGWPEVRQRIVDAADHESRCWIITMNAEILLEARRNPMYWEIAHRADLRLVDGSGPQFFGWLCGAQAKRLSGVELGERVLDLAREKQWRVALFGGTDGAADKAAWAMRAAHPRLEIVSEEGGRIDERGHGDDATEEAWSRIKAYAPDVLLVAMSNPKPDFWFDAHAHEIPSLKVMVGVGGTFDYWAGRVVRAPRLFQFLGLEWLWRVIRQPWRWKRVFNAVIVFPILAVWEKLR